MRRRARRRRDREQPQGEGQPGARRWRTCDALANSLRAEHDRGDAGREQRQPAPVEQGGSAVRRGAPGRAAGRQQPARQQQPDDPDRQVHEEDPAPGQALDDRAADDRDRAPGPAASERRRRSSRDPCARAGRLGQRDHPDRHDHAAGEALEHAEGDQRLGAPRQAAQGARHDESAATADIHTRLGPKRSAAQPVSGIAVASASR